MLTVIVLCYYLTGSSLFDTLKYPLKEGRIVDSVRENSIHPSLEAIVYPTDFYEVMSCSKGVVLNVIKYADNRVCVLIKSDMLLYSYTIDTVLTSRGQHISRGQVLGKLRRNYILSESNADYPLKMTVEKNGKEVYARKYLIFSKENLIDE